MKHYFSLQHQYNLYHDHHVHWLSNLIHYITVPSYYISALALLLYIPMPAPIDDLSRLITLIGIVYYIKLNTTMGIAFAPFVVAAYATARVLFCGVGMWAGVALSVLLQVMFVGVQLIGHMIFEGGIPPLNGTLTQFLVSSPLTNWLETIFAMGLAEGWRKELQAEHEERDMRMGMLKVTGPVH